MSLPFIAPETPDLVWFGGSDAERFLDDLISRRVSDMAPRETRRSLLLTSQGKLDHILWVLRDERLGLLTDSGRGEALASTLKRYVIRVDVVLESEAHPLWMVVGEWDGAAPAYDISWPGVTRTLVIGDRPDLPEGDGEEYERLRITAGDPRFGVDVDESTIPHESGLVPATVDFDKGCFLGQELVARIDSRGGNTPRRLVHFQFEGDALLGDVVDADGKKTGRVTSAAGSLGLGMAHRSVAVGSTVTVEGRQAVVKEIPVIG